MWDALLKSVRCEIISFKRNDEIDAYVLRWVKMRQTICDKEMARRWRRNHVFENRLIDGSLRGRGKNDANEPNSSISIFNAIALAFLQFDSEDSRN